MDRLNSVKDQESLSYESHLDAREKSVCFSTDLRLINLFGLSLSWKILYRYILVPTMFRIMRYKSFQETYFNS